MRGSPRQSDGFHLNLCESMNRPFMRSHELGAEGCSQHFSCRAFMAITGHPTNHGESLHLKFGVLSGALAYVFGLSPSRENV